MIATRCEYGLPVSEIAKLLDANGTVAVSDLVSPEWLDTARADVRFRLARNGDTDEFTFDPGNVLGSPAHQFITDPRVEDLLKGLADTQRARPTGAHHTITSALNILTGTVSGPGRARFHFDACTVTMVVPVFMPGTAAEVSGELIIFPNRRPFRGSVMVNILEKAFKQNRLYTAHCVRSLRRDPTANLLALEPGDAYLFWGYRGFHGTLPAAHGTLRATLLLHCGSPHRTSRLLVAAKWLSRKAKPPPVMRHGRSPRPARYGRVAMT